MDSRNHKGISEEGQEQVCGRISGATESTQPEPLGWPDRRAPGLPQGSRLKLAALGRPRYG